ncbi:hypothetical protein Tco_1436837, partial [Tanacetum coccineum]
NVGSNNSRVKGVSAERVSGNLPVLDNRNSVADMNGSQPLGADVGCSLLRNPRSTNNIGRGGTEIIGNKRRQTGNNVGFRKKRIMEQRTLTRAVLASNVGSNNARVEAGFPYRDKTARSRQRKKGLDECVLHVSAA